MKLFYSILIFLLLCPIIFLLILFYFYYKGFLKLSNFIQIEVMITTLVSAVSIVVTFIIQHYYKIKTDKEININKIEQVQFLLLSIITNSKTIYYDFSVDENNPNFYVYSNVGFNINDFVSLNEILLLKYNLRTKSKTYFSIYVSDNYLLSKGLGQLQFLFDIYNDAIKNKQVISKLIKENIIIEAKKLFIASFSMYQQYLSLLENKYKIKYVKKLKQEEFYKQNKILYIKFCKCETLKK